jgi:hypothetical protein
MLITIRIQLYVGPMHLTAVGPMHLTAIECSSSVEQAVV